MNCSPLTIELLCNKTHFFEALVDNGCLCRAIVRDDVVRSLQLPRIIVTPRSIEGATRERSVISEVTYLDMDIDGYKRRTWAYIAPRLSYPLILGKPWMEAEGAVYHAREHRLSIERAGNMQVWEKGFAPASKRMQQCQQAKRVAGFVFEAEKRRARRSGAARTSIFAVTLADINKALAPKPTTPVRENLPKELLPWEKLFDKAEADKLPPHRAGADHEIPLQKGEDGQEREAPWGPLYGMSRDELLVLRKTLTELLEKGYIRASSSPAGAPVLFVRKPGGGLRFCVDYRALNAITRADRYPLPLIRETLDNLSKAKWFTKLDVRAAFYKLRIKEGDEWKTAFRTRFGLFEWLVTPFGLSGAPATFQRYVNTTLRPYLDIFCSSYLDDVLIYTSGSRREHMEKVKLVLSRLQAAGLNLDIDKCEFGVTTTKYLGFIITAGEGIRMDPEKLRAISEWEAPTTLRAVRGFLGFANFYRQFIRDYAKITAPLIALTRKGTPFRWKKEEQAAFELLKLRFMSEPALAQFDPDRLTVVEADCSGWALGGCLLQENEQGVLHPVAYHSRRLTSAECNYEIHDKELLAIISCLGAWDAELRSLSRPFRIISDHKNLRYFMTTRKLSERQVRWSEKLTRYRFMIEYREGAAQERADALSRREQDIPQDREDERFKAREIRLLRPNWVAPALRPSGTIPVAPITTRGERVAKGEEVFMHEDLQHGWNAALKHDDLYPQIIGAVRRGERFFPPEWRVNEQRLSVSIAECTLDDRGILRYRGRIWVPNWEPLQTGLIQNMHDSAIGGHPGRDATLELLTRGYFWPQMFRMVRRFCRNCDVCGRKRVWRHLRKGMLKPLPVPERFWSELSIDFMTDLPAAAPGDPRFLMVITDRLSKMIVLEPMETMGAEACAERFVDCWWRFHGFPKAITSDRGSNWVGGFWSRLCELTGVEQRLSTAFHPETDGATERANQEVLAYLRGYVAYTQLDWSSLLPGAMLAINNRNSSSIGLSPFFLQHGYHLSPIQQVEISEGAASEPRKRAEDFVQRLKEATEFAQAAMAAAQQRMEETSNAHRTPSERFRKGDTVWLSLRNIRTDQPSHKLAWLQSKYHVTKVVNSHTVELDVPKGIHNRFHVDLLLRASSDPLPSQLNPDSRPPPVLPDALGGDDGEYQIESILRARTKRLRGKGRQVRQALVKWTGYQQPTWEPVSELLDTEALALFERKYGPIMTSDGPAPMARGAVQRNQPVYD